MNETDGSLALGREWKEAIRGWKRLKVKLSDYTWSRELSGRTTEVRRILWETHAARMGQRCVQRFNWNV